MSQKSMSVEFQLTEAEFVRGHRVHLRRSLLTFKNLVVLTLALLFAALQAALFGGEAWALRVFSGIWGVMLLLVAYAYFRVPRDLYRRAAHHAGSQKIVISDQGVQHLDHQYAWADFTQSFENEEFFFLHPKGKLVILIPKRALPAAGGVQEVRAFLEADSPAARSFR